MNITSTTASTEKGAHHINGSNRVVTTVKDIQDERAEQNARSRAQQALKVDPDEPTPEEKELDFYIENWEAEKKKREG